MLAYNLSPSFNWDTTGMSDDEMRNFPDELGKLGFVFNFITYGGHQIDGLAAEEFTDRAARGRHAGPGAPAAEVPPAGVALPHPADPGRRAAGGRGARWRSRAARRPPRRWARAPRRSSTGSRPRCRRSCSRTGSTKWAEHHGVDGRCACRCARTRAGADLLELGVVDDADEKLANIVFATIQDRRGRQILSVRDQNTFDTSLRRKRLMTLLHLFLIHRYKAAAIHYLTPTEDNQRQCERMLAYGIFETSTTRSARSSSPRSPATAVRAPGPSR